MSKRKNKHFWRKFTSWMLIWVLCLSGTGIMPAGSIEAMAGDSAIKIASAEDLAKIGVDQDYPMDGDYILTQDIDLSGISSWTPIGGGVGQRGAFSGDNVFSGTFDGQGHIISNLTIKRSEAVGNSWQYGLFGIVSSSNAQKPAAVRNLIFAGTDICVDMKASGENYLSLGILAGEINKNAVIENIAVVDGKVEGNPSDSGDVVGVGGLTGEMRPDRGASAENSGVTIKNIYIGADVVSGSSTDQNYVGGIVGRIANLSPALMSACVFTGNVTFKNTEGHGISGGNMFANIENCYFISGQQQTGTRVTESDLKSGTLLTGLEPDYWTAVQGSFMTLTQCADSEKFQEILALAGIVPTFADGDSYASVTSDFTVPMSVNIGEIEEAITWSTEENAPLEIKADGTVSVKGVFADTACVLTAVTKSGKTKTFSLTVKSNIRLKIDQDYAVIGQPLTASLADGLADITCTYQWSVDGVSKGTAASYTPDEADLEKMLTVTAKASKDGSVIGSYGPVYMYISKLPVVYIDTDDGGKITSKEYYKDATMRIQGNDKFNSSSDNANKVDLYDGAIEIRGRGNSTWNPYSYNKLPYKIKLKTKTNLMGFGSSKHWALLGNYMDESLIRNTTSYDLSGEMGMRYLKSTHVDVILNGAYAGNYQLVGNVRIDKNRVNIYNWEDLAEDVADAIVAKEAADGVTIKAGALEDYLNEHMDWITSGSVTYDHKTYKISDYYKGIPKTADGRVDVSGGFLYELDEYFDEASKFYTDKKLPIMFKSPEFVNTNPELFTYAQQYIQAIEDCVANEDFYLNVKKTSSGTANEANAVGFTEDYAGKQHYSDLVDVESLVRYLILNEFYWNTETMKKSTYMYKDLGKKLYVGPVWDMDWTSNSLVSESETSNYQVWMIQRCAQGGSTQSASWYISLIRDPYFVQKMLECYRENRENFNDIVKEGGIIDQDYEYLKESGDKNYEEGLQRYDCVMDFKAATERLKTFLVNRLGWMDAQFESLPVLINSLGAYKPSDKISVTAEGLDTGAVTTFTANVKDSSIAKVAFYVNGIQEGIADVAEQKAVFTSSDENLERKSGASNVIQVRAMDSSGSLISNVTNYAVFDKVLPVEELSGTVEIKGAVRARVGSVLTAELIDGNNTGSLSYQWKADGKEISGAVYQTCTLTESELGKVITVEVTSSIETGKLESAATAAILEEIKNDHLLVHQVFGGGENDNASISHSFIELYNPTEETVNLDGYRIGYYSGRTGESGYTEEEVYLALDGKKEIPPHCSYLIRCEAQQTTDPETGEPVTFMLNVDGFDQEWTLPTGADGKSGIQTIANKRYKVVLYHGTDYVDGVSVNEEAVEGTPLLDPPLDEIVSKHKSVRRKNFADTDSNSSDFEIVNYKSGKITEAEIEKKRPRTLADGEWGTEQPEPEPEELTGKVSIRGNAIVGAILYADEATNNTGTLSYQWQADGADISGATGEFFELTEAYKNKKISVTITSSVETGRLSEVMAEPVKTVEAQRDHIVINQVYGDGGKNDTAVSHSFIELYNPTEEAIDLSGYTIQYHSTAAAVSETLALSGTIPARASYLIRGAAAKASETAVQISAFDKSWELVIDNKQYSVVLKNGETYVDGVSVNETPVEGTAALTDPKDDTIISKNKAVRRIGFIDTDNNVSDFEVLNYSKLPAGLRAKTVPRKTADGAWGLAPGSAEKPVDEELLREVRSTLEEADKKAASEYEANSYQKMTAAKEALEDLLDSKDEEAIRNALSLLKQAIRDLLPAAAKPDAGLLQEAQQWLKEAENILTDATKADPAVIENLKILKAALESAIQANDAGKIQTALAGLKYAVEQYLSNNGQNNQTQTNPQVGTSFQYMKNWYKITKADASGGTVVFVKPEKKTVKNVTVPKEAVYNGIKFKVTEIEKNAFKNHRKLTKVTIEANVTKIGNSAFQGAKNLKNIIIRSKKIKTVGKNAWKGIYAKCVIKVPKAKLKAYKKKFKGKGQKSTVRVVK